MVSWSRSSRLPGFTTPSANMYRTRQSLRTLSRSLATQATASSYAPPIKAGSLPAYDQALAYITRDRESKLKQLEELKGDKEVEQAVLEKLEVEAWSNDPETRWKAVNSQGQLLLLLSRMCTTWRDFLRGVCQDSRLERYSADHRQKFIASPLLSPSD